MGSTNNTSYCTSATLWLDAAAHSTAVKLKIRYSVVALLRSMLIRYEYTDPDSRMLFYLVQRGEKGGGLKASLSRATSRYSSIT